jgi:membrane dipeptidase
MLRALIFALALAAPDAQRIHREAIVVDTHNDITSAMVDDGFDLGKRDSSGFTETDIPRMKEGGLDAEFFAVYVSADYARKGGAARRALTMIDAVHEAARRNPDMEMAYTAADIRRIARSGKIAALMGVEGGHAIEDSLPVLRQFHRLGIRYMTLTHSNNNNWADSSGDVKRHAGLTDFGRQVVREMNRLGMMVDISHVSDDTFYDVLKTTRAPVIASHSSARALVNAPRNMTDDMLRAVAKNGGVVMVNFGGWFLHPDAEAEWNAKLKPEYAALRKKYAGNPAALEREQRKLVQRLPKIPLSSLIDHFVHIARTAGVDHVGIGSDFDGVSGYLPQGMEDITKLPAITAELLKRGFSEADVKKVLGENILRVMEEVERRAGHS